MPIYEVGIYNEIVRKHVREGTDIPKHIEINTDFENDNTLKKRNFWKLFKKND